MNLFKKIIVSSLYFLGCSLGMKCFTKEDVKNQGLVSYENKVYDITNYYHPGGQELLMLCKGKALEDFFNDPAYSFHKNSRMTISDLNRIYVGTLNKTCGDCNNTITTNYNYEKLIYISNNSSLYFSIISLSFFVFMIISTIIINNTNLYLFFGKIINLYCWYPTIAEILFLSIFLIWWTSLFVLSIFADRIFLAQGVWICLNIAFTLLPMTRNSIWIKYLNCPYNSLMLAHKFVAILSVFSVIVKCIFIVYIYNFKFLFAGLPMAMGTVSSLSIILTSILAIPPIRKHIFELFYYSHRILCIVTIVTMTLHYISSIYYVIPSLFLYLIDLFLRILYIKKAIYTKIVTYDLAFNQKYNIMTLKFQDKIDVSPGTYFFICCKNISKTQWHPMSLMNIRNKALNFCIKDMGENSWSHQLIKYHENHEDIDILLQGPYMHFKNNYNYKNIVFVSTGVGVTPFFSILDDIKKNKPENLNKIIFIWIIPHESYIVPFLNIFDTIDTKLITIDIYITRSVEDDLRILDDKYYLLLNIIKKRPSIENCINDFISTNAIVDMTDICIFSCGSRTITKDLCKLCSKLNIDLYNENFT
jgi:NAD(P)H-flavin reductase